MVAPARYAERPKRQEDVEAPSGTRGDKMSEWIPINPPINTKGQHDREMANQATSVRDRQVRRVVIPADEPDVEVKPVPVQRRHFVDPNAIGGRPLRKD
jgi:hypothetical protein